MKYTKTIKTVVLCLGFVLLPSTSASNAFAGENLLFSIFIGTSGTEVFPETLEGKSLVDVMSKQGFDLMLTSRTAGLKNNDVWTAQSDTLREEGGKIMDLGINCDFALTTQPDLHANGLCNIFSGELDAEGTKTTHILKSPAIKGNALWYKVFEDKKLRIAGYITHRMQ